MDEGREERGVREGEVVGTERTGEGGARHVPVKPCTTKYRGCPRPERLSIRRQHKRAAHLAGFDFLPRRPR